MTHDAPSLPLASAGFSPRQRVSDAFAAGLRLARLFDALGLLLIAALMAAASPPAGAQQADDPPGRVARLSDFNGQVWLYGPDTGDWVSADRNRPITAGDRLATDPGAHAELQLGSTTMRLDADTELEVLALDDERVALQLHTGSVVVLVRDAAGAGQFELTTDDGRFVVDRVGSYRFDRGDARSVATVLSGQVRYEGPNSALPVTPGQRAEFWIDSGGVAQYTLGAPANDAFAAWNADRDRRYAVGISERYVSPEMTGVADLDRYGRWEQSPDYGALWIPTAVAADWAPYSHGHWAWVRPWGWTWVDDAPWGFAPFHYGRWVYARNNWCWTPGTRVARPVYAPALVAWVGGPRGEVAVEGRGPAVGWFPLAPREVYVPSYRVSPHYVQRVNITNVSNVTQIINVYNNPQAPRDFNNRHFPRAITVVPANVMASRQPVAPAAAQWRQTPWVRDFANQPGRPAALLAPPVSAPPLPARPADPRGVRPPPGFAQRPAESPQMPRPGGALQMRERERDRGADRPEPGRPLAAEPAQMPGRGSGDRALTQPAIQPAPAAAPVYGNRPPVAGPGAAPPSFSRPPEDRGRDEQRIRDDRGRDERGWRGGQRGDAPAMAQPGMQAPQPVQLPTAPPQTARPAATSPVQEGPMMRPLPMRRGEERPAVQQPMPAQVQAPQMQPRPQMPPPQAPQVQPLPQMPRAEQPVQPQPRVERPAFMAPPPRPAEAVRPPEVQRPAAAPAPAPEIRRAEPGPRRDGADPKRGDQR